VNNQLDVKENNEHALELALHFPFGGLLLSLRHITLNPTLIASVNPGQEGCIIGGDLTKLLTTVDMLLLLISCHKLHHNSN
jgi:hypothetical protein